MSVVDSCGTYSSQTKGAEKTSLTVKDRRCTCRMENGCKSRFIVNSKETEVYIKGQPLEDISLKSMKSTLSKDGRYRQIPADTSFRMTTMAVERAKLSRI